MECLTGPVNATDRGPGCQLIVRHEQQGVRLSECSEMFLELPAPGASAPYFSNSSALAPVERFVRSYLVGVTGL